MVLPTTILAIFGTLFGLAGSLDGANRLPHAVLMLAVLCAGWFGIATLWRLSIGLLRGRPPANARVVWAGLVAGGAVSVVMIWSTHSIGPVLLFGWPLIAALHLGNEFSKTCPLITVDVRAA